MYQTSTNTYIFQINLKSHASKIVCMLISSKLVHHLFRPTTRETSFKISLIYLPFQQATISYQFYILNIPPILRLLSIPIITIPTKSLSSLAYTRTSASCLRSPGPLLIPSNPFFTDCLSSMQSQSCYSSDWNALEVSHCFYIKQGKLHNLWGY